MSYVERAWKKGKLRRPTEFLPNGCGPKAGVLTSILVPDEIAGVGYSDCCDRHDLAYYEGGLGGLLTRKPRADLKLGACVVRHFFDAGHLRWDRGTAAGKAKAVGTFALGAIAGPVYTLAVTLLGWTPFTWRWRRRYVSAPALAELNWRLAAANNLGDRDDG